MVPVNALSHSENENRCERLDYRPAWKPNVVITGTQHAARQRRKRKHGKFRGHGNVDRAVTTEGQISMLSGVSVLPCDDTRADAVREVNKNRSGEATPGDEEPQPGPSWTLENFEERQLVDQFQDASKSAQPALAVADQNKTGEETPGDDGPELEPSWTLEKTNFEETDSRKLIEFKKQYVGAETTEFDESAAVVEKNSEKIEGCCCATSVAWSPDSPGEGDNGDRAVKQDTSVSELVSSWGYCGSLGGVTQEASRSAPSVAFVACDSSGELVEVPYMVTPVFNEVESELVEVPAMVSPVSVEVERAEVNSVVDSHVVDDVQKSVAVEISDIVCCKPFGQTEVGVDVVRTESRHDSGSISSLGAASYANIRLGTSLPEVEQMSSGSCELEVADVTVDVKGDDVLPTVRPTAPGLCHASTGHVCLENSKSEVKRKLSVELMKL